MPQSSLILCFPECEQQVVALANTTGLPWKEVNIHRFPDGESKLTLPQKLPAHIIIYRSLDHPNDKLVELLLVAAAARKQGCTQITLVAPYLCYMRQDIAFNPGEVVSQKIIGHILAEYFDTVITVDAHLHRIQHLSEAIPLQTAINLTATHPMADFLKQTIDNPFLIGPDEESEQWVAATADFQGFDYSVAHKERHGDKDVTIQLPHADYKGRHIVLLDDVASTGRTLEIAAKGLIPFQPASVSVLVTHALFVDDAIERLQQLGINNIWSCDSVVHASNRISLAGLLGECVSGLNL